MTSHFADLYGTFQHNSTPYLDYSVATSYVRKCGASKRTRDKVIIQNRKYLRTTKFKIHNSELIAERALVGRV